MTSPDSITRYPATAVGARDYRVLGLAEGSPHAGLLHLVREDAEASLCGIPRAALGDPTLDQLVCSDCIEWLNRRRQVSGQYRRVDRG